MTRALAMQDYPNRKLGKTSSQNFLNSAPMAGSTGPNPWFAPAPTVGHPPMCSTKAVIQPVASCAVWNLYVHRSIIHYYLC